jgi:rare lipoprotein A (peptidoglycan hydrolase)
VSLVLARRQAALAGVALLATILVLGLGRDTAGEPEPAPVPPAQGAWKEAVAGSYGPGRYGTTTACGLELTQALRGVAHPVLPCGARLVLGFGQREIETSVVDRGPSAPGREFDVTAALARELGMGGTETVRWRFATG